jgi:hypothetical protein
MPEVIKDRTLLESLTTAQLKAMAKKRDIEGLSKLKKPTWSIFWPHNPALWKGLWQRYSLLNK